MNFKSLPALVMHCLAALALDCCALGLAGAPEFFAQVFRLEDFTEILRLGLRTQLAAKGRLSRHVGDVWNRQLFSRQLCWRL